jgi:deoxycytidine triphosphate deaminase
VIGIDIATSGWLTGTEIRDRVASGHITIQPFDPALLNPNSYNYRLGPCLRRIKNDVIDLKQEDEYEELNIPEDGLVLRVGECYLGCTVEVFGSDYYVSDRVNWFLS